MGVTLAGFDSVAVIERDKYACDTVRENIRRGYPLTKDWPIWEGDVRDFDWSGIKGEIDLIAGGPPCQPFSLGGKHGAFSDSRDMFPCAVDVVRQLKPKSFVFENVKGLTRSSFANYYQYILLQLEFPEISRKVNESWTEHLRRLQEIKTSVNVHASELIYNVVPTLVNAADYGVPQRRERVFIVGFRADLGIEWSFPLPTHSYETLLFSQWISHEYWDKHKIPKSMRPKIPRKLENKIWKLRDLSLLIANESPWRTVRDALNDLPDPKPNNFYGNKFYNHNFQDGAKVYKGHTGSPLDMPSKTLKAGDHGVPGGENMVILDDGSVRYFSVRESARLQTFPDGYVFHGSWTETMRQLGNAVPVVLARKVVASVAESLAEAEIKKINSAKKRSVA